LQTLSKKNSFYKPTKRFGLYLHEIQKLYLIPDKYVTPFDVMQARRFRLGEESDDLEKCLQEAYAVHYFFNGWLTNKN
jgi:hypothetical protein